ncbi:hypothetical protein [Amycolatopsis sp. Poz14]|uniref:hypothetical protein n=1 Tax=Amycolatopsis sp. Poz14 TaxID=1447705 RepID=UPI001EE82266|nr:hypothetical protein [Amycolatopsis sp. Poz14]MCG3757379.1 hypothetical protein [Amycolatopsis sp. Poz14]
MSRSWSGGSTPRWRKLRMQIATRDRWVCGLCHQPIDPTMRHPHPRCLHVHHTKGKRHGDDPRYLMATHAECNLAAGEPDEGDPRPTPRTRW